MKITYYGHACVMIEVEGKKLLIDPFLRDNPLCPVKPEELAVDCIALTHGHSDHLGEAVFLAQRNKAPVVAIFELALYLQTKGVSWVEPMNIGGKISLPWGDIRLVPAFHSSSIEEGKERRYLGMPAGIVFTSGGKTVYHAGDTGLFSDMKLIGELYHPNVALLPIGDRFTMGPAEALKAAQWIRPQVTVPIHYNTFPVIKQDPHAFVADLEKMGLKGVVLAPGEALTIS